MMTGQGRNRRRRGRRGQRPQQDVPQQEQQGTVETVTPAMEVEEPARAQERPVREARGPRDGEDPQGARQDGGAGRKRVPRRRRTSRRPDVGPVPTEVLRKNVRDLPPTGPIVLRRIDEIASGDGITFGCPMLTRTRIGMPWAGGQRAPRCSMGWAVHNEEEASFCMRTPDLIDCWKEHPEREAALRAGQETENAAD
jgi:hypothetical protein